MRHSQKLKELERRRRRGARLLAGGESQAEVARRVGVSRQTVMRWDRARQEGGIEALRRAPHFGRPERLSAAHRLLNGVMDGAADRAADRDEVLRETGSHLGLAVARTAGLERAAADGPRARTRRASGSNVEGQEVARTKKIAARQGRVIVFIDESGLSERPCRARTWAPKGQTPVLQYSFSWKQLSVIAGLSYWRFYFPLVQRICDPCNAGRPW
jgi:transcriptional regulator with XRE-family HTH domain